MTKAATLAAPAALGTGSLGAALKIGGAQGLLSGAGGSSESTAEGMAIDALKGMAFLIQIGSGEPLFRFTGIDLDLTDQTSVCDVLDLASVADALLGYCSFFVPLAESFRKPALLVWSRAGLKSPQEFQ